MASNKGGRPTAASPPGQKVTLSIRTTPGTKSELALAAEEEGANLSEQAEAAIRAGLRERQRDADHVHQTLLMLGEDDRGLALLLVLALQRLRARGSYFDSPAEYQRVTRGLGRLFQRLASPDNGSLIDDRTCPEDRIIDDLLETLGHETRYPSAPTSEEVWATAQRARLGRFGPLLIKMYQAAKAYLYETPRQPMRASPEAIASWEAAHERNKALDPVAEELRRARQDLDWALNASRPAEERAHYLRRASESIAWLAKRVDEATIAELRALIAAVEAAQPERDDEQQ